MWKPRCLIEMNRAGVDLGRVYRQAFDYWIQAVPDRPRYVVLCNFDEFWIYNFDQQLDAPMDRVPFDELPHRWEALGFLLPDPAAPIFRHGRSHRPAESIGQLSPQKVRFSIFRTAGWPGAE
jgi:hypothetical protein